MKILITDKKGLILYEGSPSLHGDGVVIGSGNECDIQLNKMGIARRQLQIRYNSDGYLTLQDLQSPHGTVINGKRNNSTPKDGESSKEVMFHDVLGEKLSIIKKERSKKLEKWKQKETDDHE